MKRGRGLFLILSAVLGLLISCKGPVSPIPQVNPATFNQYWFQGKAEISSYTLNQARYGAAHDGKTILVFVTEDFSKSKQVKLDNPETRRSDAVPVLKLNNLTEFVTGIYKYSNMTSVYTPVDRKEYPHSLKLMASSQEWCGQTYMQANWKGNRYEIQQMSYFESDGDSKMSLARAILEDEIWTTIRVAPNTLPLGDVKMITSPIYLRYSHKANKLYEATASLIKNGDVYTYSINYPELGRTLDIEFESAFPHKILGWKDAIGLQEVTTARLNKSIMSDYWNHQQPADEILRTDLGLE